MFGSPWTIPSTCFQVWSKFQLFFQTTRDAASKNHIANPAYWTRWALWIPSLYGFILRIAQYFIHRIGVLYRGHNNTPTQLISRIQNKTVFLGSGVLVLYLYITNMGPVLILYGYSFVWVSCPLHVCFDRDSTVYVTHLEYLLVGGFHSY